MEEYIKTLEKLITEGPVNKIDDKSTYELSIIDSLLKSEFITAKTHRPIKGGPVYHSVEVTISGREWLEMRNSKSKDIDSGVINNNNYYMTGTNARLNNNSTDNSTNTINVDSSIPEYIQALRDEITHQTDLSKQKDAFEVVDALEGQFASGNPSKLVVTTLLSALPDVASIASIGSFLLSYLTKT